MIDPQVLLVLQVFGGEIVKPIVKNGKTEYIPQKKATKEAYKQISEQMTPSLF
ncbi:MAG: hypothetical protein LBM93_15140 [Oscillospiraceae bacterium]|jgi:hypothetical protein|nr:hypothetical protein [Oscillospiraceae bacterium]